MDSEISTGYRELRTFLGTDWEHFIEQQRLGYVRVGQAFIASLSLDKNEGHVVRYEGTATTRRTRL